MAIGVQTAAAQPPKGWIATLVVALLMIGIVGGGFVAENAVANEPRHQVDVQGVVITPMAEWEFAGRSDDGNTILLTNGSGSLAIEVVPGTDVVAALNSKRDEWESTGTVTTADPEPVTVGSRSGYRLDYTGTFEDVSTAVEGTVTGIAGNGRVVLFDGWAGEGQYPTVSDDIDAMIGSAVIP